jgi:hypothetical protein
MPGGRYCVKIWRKIDVKILVMHIKVCITSIFTLFFCKNISKKLMDVFFKNLIGLDIFGRYFKIIFFKNSKKKIKKIWGEKITF